MSVRMRNLTSSAFVAFALASCSGTPSATLPMSGLWEWGNVDASYVPTLNQDRQVCVAEAEGILSQLRQCATIKPQNCGGLTDNVAKAMCQYANSTTKNMCSVGRITIPKQEIVDGCISARGWKQAWVKTRN